MFFLFLDIDQNLRYGIFTSIAPFVLYVCSEDNRFSFYWFSKEKEQMVIASPSTGFPKRRNKW